MQRGPAVATLDQAASSASNVLLSLVIARSVSQVEFGTFALVLMGYALMLGVNRALCSETYAVLSVDVVHRREGVVAASRLAGVVFMVGLGFTVSIFVVIELLLKRPLDWTEGWVLVAFPLLAVQDYLRVVAFSWNRAWAALVADTSWLAIFVLVLTFGPAMSLHAPAQFSFAWCVSGIATVPILWLAFLRAEPRRSVGEPLVRRMLRLGAPAAADTLAIVGAAQTSFFVAAGVLGAAGIAGPRGALILLGPLTVLYTGVTQALIPHLAQQGSSGRHAVGRLQILFVGAAALAYVCLALLPASVGVGLLGSTWEASSRSLLPMSVYCAVVGLILPMIMQGRLLQGNARLFRNRLGVALLTPVVAYAGSTFSVSGFAWALVAMVALDAITIKLTVVRLARRGPSLPAGSESDRLPTE